MLSPLQLQYLQLVQCNAIPRNSLSRLLKHCGTLEKLVSFSEQNIPAPGFDPRQWEILQQIVAQAPVKNVGQEQISRWLEGEPASRRLLCYEEQGYPDLLREIAVPPILLFVDGNSCLNLPQLAIVGSRRSSSNGEHTARWLAGELARFGFCITSGLAAGIDSCAHQGALAVGGKTLGILGTGIDRIYPPRNRKLAGRIIHNGALISEFPLGMAPIASNFPQRNRIIAGLSVGVIVVEATPKSGSLITARLAMEADREVFAIPGSIHNGNSMGCHQLIREGAKLVEDVESVVEELAGPLMGAIESHRRNLSDKPDETVAVGATKAVANTLQTATTNGVARVALDDSERALLRIMEFDPYSADVLAARAGMEIELVSRLLAGLELKGVIRQSGGRFQQQASGLQRLYE